MGSLILSIEVTKYQLLKQRVLTAFPGADEEHHCSTLWKKSLTSTR